MYIKFTNLKKRYNDNVLFSGATFVIGEGFYGLIGNNGVGKTTLLKLIRKDIIPNEGQIITDFNGKIQYISSENYNNLNISIMDYFFETFPNLKLLKNKINDGDTQYIQEYKLSHGFEMENTFIDNIKKYIGEDIDINENIGLLSSGQQTLLNILPIASVTTGILLLDEPSNFLDKNAIKILVDILKEFKGILIFSTHDEKLLEMIATGIIQIKSKKITVINASYEMFLKAEENILIEEDRNNTKIKKEIKDLKTSLNSLHNRIDKMNSRKIRDNDKRSFNFHNQRALTKISGIKNNINRRIDEKFISMPEQTQPITFRFQPVRKQSTLVCSINELEYGYDGIPLNKKITKEIYSDKIYRIEGGNGVGKSTLIKTIVGELTKISGDIVLSEKLKIGYLPQIKPSLNISILDFLLKELTIPLTDNKVTELLRLNNFFKPIETNLMDLSSGELNIVYIISIFANSPDFVFLDEPTNFMDMINKENFADFLLKYNGGYVIVSHDIKFLETFKFDDVIYL